MKLYVAIGPRREGMWKQHPIVGTDLDDVIEEAAHAFELPAPAIKQANWEYVDDVGHPKVWMYKSTNVPYGDDHNGKHYVYEKEVEL